MEIAESTRPESTGTNDDRLVVRVMSLRERLLAHAFLFDDPGVYRAGVEDALTGVEEFLSDHR